MYNRNADFEELCDRIDAHVFTGDTLTDPEMRTLLTSYIKRWVPQIKSWNEIQAESPEEEITDEPIEEPKIVTKVTEPNKDIVDFEDDVYIVINGTKFDKRRMSWGEHYLTKDRVWYSYDTNEHFVTKGK